jgi:excisionase family DNA binding protein
MNEFGQKGVVPLAERLSLSPEEASALTGIGLTTVRMATYSGALVARKNGKNTIILPDDLKTWLKALPKMGNKVVSDEEVNA